MPTHLEVRPEIADKLAALAKARGMSVDELLLEVLDGLELPQDVTGFRVLRDEGAVRHHLHQQPAGRRQGTGRTSTAPGPRAPRCRRDR